MLAGDLVPCLIRRGHEAVDPAESDFDVTDEGCVARVVADSAPDCVINCSGYNFVDRAETDFARAEAINGHAVRNLCVACEVAGIPLVHFSTDYVFDGMKRAPYTIDDEPNPLNAYGRSKLLGESFVRGLMSRFYLLRTSWLFGLHGNNFVEAILRRAEENKPLRVVDDERGCPTWTMDLCRATLDLVERAPAGVYHVTNSDSTTWYDFAEEILRLSNLDVPLHRAAAAEIGREARRPAYSVLDPHPLPGLLGREMPTWKRALRAYLSLRQESLGA